MDAGEEPDEASEYQLTASAFRCNSGRERPGSGGKLSSLAPTVEADRNMRERRVWMITIMLLVWSALYLVALNATRSHAQNLVVLHPDHMPFHSIEVRGFEEIPRLFLNTSKDEFSVLFRERSSSLRSGLQSPRCPYK